MTEIKILDICLIDENGNSLKIGSAKVLIDILPKTIISDKEKMIILKDINLFFKDGDVIYNNGGYWLNAKYSK